MLGDGSGIGAGRGFFDERRAVGLPRCTGGLGTAGLRRASATSTRNCNKERMSFLGTRDWWQWRRYEISELRQ